MLNLPEVTLGCVDTRTPEMALRAIRHCMRQASFGDAILFTAPGHGLVDLPDGLRIVTLEDINTIEAYSNFMVKGMAPFISTTHVLIVQWDGFIITPEQWRPAFLEVDYIGAVWPQYKDASRVGNGGFSLRSKRLLEVLQHEDIQAHHPEDVCIARTNRSVLETRWRIRFADEMLARHFAIERETQVAPSFGFHGLSNMARLMPTKDLEALVNEAPSAIFASTEARGFVKGLIERGMTDLAHEAIRKRRLSHGMDWSELRLWVRLLAG